MFQEHTYELSRQKYVEHNAQFEQLYAPIQDAKPGFLRRLLASLRGDSLERARQTGVQVKPQQTRARVVAK
jgi:hypothetical protein